MEVAEAIKGRRSIRRYQTRDVEKWKILELIEAARWAPSAGNTQTWRFYIVKNERVKLALYRAALNQNVVKNAPLVIVVCFDMKEMYSYYGERGVRLYGIQDTAAAIQNMLLRAHDLGLGACWVGAFDEKAVASALGLKDNLRVVALITVGYPAEKPSSYRKAVEEIARFID